MQTTFKEALTVDGETSHSPLFFSIASDAEHDAFLALYRESGARVVDTIDRQLLEWARIQMPSEPFGSDASRALVAREIASAGATMKTYGVWCYYPWRRTAAHILPQDKYFVVRTNRNREKITDVEQRRFLDKRVAVIGLSVGHAAAMVLAQERLCSELRIADFDQLDLSNMNRLRTSVLNVGLPKTWICARDIAEIDPFITVRPFHDGATAENLEDILCDGGPIDLVVEECDTLPIKLRVRELARKHGIPVVMDTNDRGLLDVERFDLERARPVLHGLLGAHTAESAAAVQGPERVKLFCDFFGGREAMSAPMQESMGKIGRELVSFPQLSSDVHLGGALVGHAVREIFCDRLKRSGRYAIDLHERLDDKGEFADIAGTGT